MPFEFSPEAIELEQTETKGRFYYNQGTDEAEMTFTKAGESLLIIDHTQVPPAFSGTGLGTALVEKAIELARTSDRKVVPLCPYAAHQFRKHPEWHDVLSK